MLLVEFESTLTNMITIINESNDTQTLSVPVVFERSSKSLKVVIHSFCMSN